jgi:hypothetical protein
MDSGYGRDCHEYGAPNGTKYSCAGRIKAVTGVVTDV